MANDIVYWVWYSRLTGIKSAAKLKLIERVASPKEIFCTAGECFRSDNIASSIIDNIAKQSAVDSIEKYISILEQYDDIGIVTYYDCNYPKMLLQINDPPLVLYYKGDLSVLDDRCVAIVGTRNAADKGKYHARSFAQELAACGRTVVSGMAAGIDAAAHMGALSAHGKTCAVLGCGVDVVYPAENKELYKRLCENGLVISEFLPGTKPDRWHFPHRNRIISGLSEATLLIEAPKKSGAINTANHAVNQNRDVFVLGGYMDDPMFSGNKALADDGAVVVTNPYDIINNSGFTAYDSNESVLSEATPKEDTHKRPGDGAREELAELKALFGISDTVQNAKQDEPEISEEKDTSALSECEAKIYALLGEGQLQFDEIVMMSGGSVADVGFALTMLEFNGYIKQKQGKRYERA